MLKGIFVSVLLLLTTVAFGQVRVEVVGAPNLSGKWSGDHFLEGSNSYFGFTTGVGASYGLRRENHFVSAQLLYERKNDEAVLRVFDQNFSATYHVRLRFNYLTIPMMYGIQTNGRVRWTFAAGPYVSTILSAVGFYNNAPDEKFDLHPNTFDFGLTGQIAAYFPVNDRSSIKVGIQDNFGLAKVYDESDFKNNSLNLQVGWTYLLKDASFK